MPVLRGIGALARCCAGGGQLDLHEVTDAALVWEEEEILWAGPEAELPEAYAGMDRWDAAGGLVTPGLVDCHTHLAFGGWRADEFEQRVRGAGYLELARAGGGIASTVRATREATREALVEKALPMLGEMAALGVTTVECKSGYGLDTTNELKLLRVYARGSTSPLSMRWIVRVLTSQYSASFS